MRFIIVGMTKARFWHTDAAGVIECGLCPRRCRLEDGGRGFCRVRRRDGDELVSDSYGRVCAVAVDPIEKKPLRHFMPGSRVFSIGTVGCNLGCKFCQNYTLSRGEPGAGDYLSPQQVVALAQGNGCASVAFTYNDPIVFCEYAIDCADVCHAAGLKTVAVTNGWMEAEAARQLFAVMDAANVDLKAFSDDFYRRLCGGSLQPVLDNLVAVRRSGRTWLECTTLLIPGYNDSSAELEAMTRWIVANLGSDVPWHFSAYHPVPAWSEALATPLESLLRAQRIGQKNGMQHIYLGNVRI